MRDETLERAAEMFADRNRYEPRAVVAALECAAQRIETPCGTATMVWRRFGSGSPLVLFHGGHGSWLHWLPVIPTLARHHTVFVPDLPGFGESADLEAPLTSGQAGAKAVAAPVLTGLDILCRGESPALAGFSFGGVIAATVAAALGRSANALVIVGSPGLGLQPTGRLPTRSVRHLSTPTALAEAHRANLAAMMIHNADRIDDVAVHIQSLNVPRTRTPSRLVSRSTALGDALANIRCPITAIYGEFDVVSPQHEERLRILGRLSPFLRQIILPSVGHWAPYEAPEEVASMILAACDPV